MNPSDLIGDAAKRATLKHMADDKIKALSESIKMIGAEGQEKTHQKLAEAIAERMRLEKP